MTLTLPAVKERRRCEHGRHEIETRIAETGIVGRRPLSKRQIKQGGRQARNDKCALAEFPIPADGMSVSVQFRSDLRQTAVDKHFTAGHKAALVRRKE